MDLYINHLHSLMTGYLIREHYLKKIRAGRDDTDVIKVITGMRRSGKSVLLEQYADELKRSGIAEDNIIFINFEHFEYQYIKDSEQLNSLLQKRIHPDVINYVLLDEIQNIHSWELSLSALNAAGNCDVYVTGSNSDLLSSQLATHISGRHVEIKVFPLSLAEFMELNGITDREEGLSQYLEFGGLPGIDITRDQHYIHDYLQGVFLTIIVKDVRRHVHVSDPDKVEEIAKFLYSNIGNLTNKSSIAKDTGLPESTVSLYLKAMEDAFLILPCDRYDMVGRKLLSTNCKYYVTDLGIRKAVLNMSVGTDISRPLENIVYVELLRRGYDVRVGSYRDSEVDFLAKRYDSVEYFQVSQTIMSPETRDREFRPLKRPRDNYPKTILTLDRFGLGDENGIKVRNIIEWLLSDQA